ncbi:PREDICTED: protein MIZU-KUSSEI 1-like [Camelina sativa]|uniref:Protein MIZU-KUSSEI 1-like n=1 Tax=Camelina sativa TaxID=90675 RepID=A0ABM0YBJ4_CAMSA|nr:PREDICTED: protein MIZU-KUSSEI 1-like [Camelina sativa]
MPSNLLFSFTKNKLNIHFFNFTLKSQLSFQTEKTQIMRTMVDLGKQRDQHYHHMQIITTPTTVDCAREFRLRRTLRSLIECMLPYCCTYQQPPSPSHQNDTVSVSSSTSSSSSSDHSSSSSSSSHSNSIVSGTFFGHRRGRVSFCLQDSTAVGSSPLLLLELAVPTAALAKEMDEAGVLRIALECDPRRSSNSRSSSIFDVPVWSMCCNGRKMGFAVRRKVTENDAVFLRMMQSVSVGAGVVPLDEEEQTLYLRARFERVTGSSDSESFHMMNPGGSYGQELSIFLLRS